MLLKLWSLIALASLRNMLKMPVLKTHLGLTKSETLGVGPSNLFFSQACRVMLMHAKLEKPGPRLFLEECNQDGKEK